VTYSFHSAARLEHLDNVVFYESRQAGLGREYLMAFEAAARRLQEVCSDIASSSNRISAVTG
jgi:hypothetical protein